MVGDFRNSVSYAAIAFFPPAAGSARTDPPSAEEAKPAGPRPLNDDEQAFLLELARHTITALVGHSPVPEEETPARFPAGSPLRELRGVFVTLTTIPGNQLRGCIGNIEGDLPLTSGVVQNAIAAASRDPRFIPVGRDELDHLHLEISVLTPLEEVSGPEAIVIGRDGVVMEKHGRRAVFLPQVAPEQGWDVPEMLRNLSLKAGLGPNDWKSGATFSTFQAQVFEEKTPGGKSGSGK
jgi:AmmeMemoRadiSam system protein A